MLFSDDKKNGHFLLCTIYCCVLIITNLTQRIQQEKKKLKYNKTEFPELPGGNAKADICAGLIIL